MLRGISAALIGAVDEALEDHELIKIKFNDFKERAQKIDIVERIEKETASEMVGMVGHIAIFYRVQSDPDKRKIVVPKRSV